jgi:hypothetical protein
MITLDITRLIVQLIYDDDKWAGYICISQNTRVLFST